jgi:hypothetical protein
MAGLLYAVVGGLAVRSGLLGVEFIEGLPVGFGAELYLDRLFWSALFHFG